MLIAWSSTYFMGGGFVDEVHKGNKKQMCQKGVVCFCIGEFLSSNLNMLFFFM
jgi:hypothetical protein